MNRRELVEAMLEWELKTLELRALTRLIEGKVLELGETQIAGNVRATYNKGRQKFGWREAVGMTLKEAEGQRKTELNILINKHSKINPTIDYKTVCKEAEIGDIPVLSQGSPSVTISLKESEDGKV